MEDTTMRTSLLAKLTALMLAAAFVAGCDRDGPVEEAGEAIDDTVEEVREGGENVGNAIEDACEEVKEGVDADDKDC
jgi:hypothetical protein